MTDGMIKKAAFVAASIDTLITNAKASDDEADLIVAIMAVFKALENCGVDIPRAFEEYTEIEAIAKKEARIS